MDVLEIETREELEAWFRERPPVVAQVVAARAALRSLPYIVEAKNVENFAGDILLPVFWAVSTSWVARKYPTHDVAIASAAATASAFVSRAADLSSRSAEVAGAIRAAAHATYAAADFAIAAAVRADSAAATYAAARVATVTVWKESLQDCVFLQDSIDLGGQAEHAARDLAGRRLWRTQSIPAETLERWNELKGFFSNADDNWQMWWDWYRARLVGGKTIDVPSDLLETLDVRIATLDEELWEQGPAAVNAEVQKLMDEAFDDLSIKEKIMVLLKDNDGPMSIDDVVLGLKQIGYEGPRHSVRGRLNELTYAGLIERISEGLYALPATQTVTSPELPAIPDQADGIKFIISEDQKIAVDLSGTLSEDSETELFASLRSEMLVIVDELLDSTRGSNAFAMLNRTAARYKAALEQEPTDNSLAQLVVQGLLLNNEYEAIQKEVDKGDLPEPDRDITTPLNGLIATHGMAVLSTNVGKKLLAKEREYNHTPQDDVAYKEAAEPVIDALADEAGLLEPDARQILLDMHAQLGKGRQADRSGLLTRIATNNLVRLLGSAVIGGALSASELGGAVFSFTAEFIDLSANFFLNYKRELLAMASLVGNEMAWLRALVEWVRAKYNV